MMIFLIIIVLTKTLNFNNMLIQLTPEELKEILNTQLKEVKVNLYQTIKIAENQNKFVTVDEINHVIDSTKYPNEILILDKIVQHDS